ncbi:MAG: hypothetical protein JRJ84_10890 [Deltaproteobacteria bacterium]|nr:hypothetical protein [Deltaproteobacteria bacterium]
MILGAAEAIGATAALLVYSLAVLLWRRARSRDAELLVVVIAVVAVAMGLHPFGATRAALWQEVILHPAVLALGLLALFQSRAVPGASFEPTPANAVVGGLLLGWLPTVALLAPRAPGPARAARLALLSTAASAASPIGGPVQLLVADGTVGWSLWALVPALAALGVAWPWREAFGRPGLDRRVAVAGALGIVVSWAVGALLGITVAAMALLVANRNRPSPPGAERGSLLRHSVAAHLAGGFAQVAGIGWLGALAIDQAMAASAGPMVLGAVCAAGGLVATPMLYATVGERIADSLIGLPETTRFLLTLPAALSPIPALLLAARVHGRGVWRLGLLIGAAQLCIALGWILLVSFGLSPFPG